MNEVCLTKICLIDRKSVSRASVNAVLEVPGSNRSSIAGNEQLNATAQTDKHQKGHPQLSHVSLPVLVQQTTRKTWLCHRCFGSLASSSSWRL